MEDKKRNILFSQEQIQTRVKELGQQITKDYEQNSTEQKSKGSTFHRSFIPCTIP